jgi:N-glycosylase/DNA lyase
VKTVWLDPEQPFDLTASLESGQAHRWRREEEWFTGVVRANHLRIRQKGHKVEFHSEPWPEASLVPLLRSYFRLDDDLEEIYGEITQDQRVAAMVDRYPGLRVLRQEPWECFIAFICSANSNIPRIHQVMERMADSFGEPIDLGGQVRHSFPTPCQLNQAGEQELRRLGLGFRAPYVAKAATAVAEGGLDLDALVRAPYAEAKERLMECSGIGPKIADCIAVFSLDKLEAFPIDVWVRRALGEWYFPGQKTPPDRVLLEWAHGYFGRYGGYSQQYLFHGRRLEK